MSLGARYMLLATFAFACMNAAVKELGNIPEHQIILIRSIVSGIICWHGIQKLGLKPLGNNRKYLLMRGVFGVIALLLYFYTLHEIPLASAVLLVYLSPVFTAIVGIFLLKEKVKAIQWLFFLMALSGAYVLKLDKVEGDQEIEMIWIIFGILAAFFSAVAYVAVRKVKETDHPYVVVFYFPLIAIPIMAVWSCFEWVQPTLFQWLLLLMVGIFTQIGQYYMAKALQLERAEKMVAMKYIGVIYALILGYVFFDELPGTYTFLGILLVAGGIIMNIRVKHIQ